MIHMDNMIKFVLYFLFFAIIHSILAMDHTKNMAGKLLGKGFRYYRMIYSLISIPLLAPAFMMWVTFSKSTTVVYVIPHDLYPVVILVRLVALGMFGYAILQIDLLEFSGIKREKKKILLTGGAYGIVRHPFYTAGILILIAQMEMTMLDMIAVLLVSGYFVAGAFIEERRLLLVFGDEYRKYQKQVPMFIPVKWFAGKLSRI
jgi:methanethiol S-methyltransferase